MKNLFKIAVSVIFVSILFTCNKEDYSIQNSLVQFSIITPQTTQKSTQTNTAKSIVISIVDNRGQLVFDTEVIELTNFNGSYISKTISLKPGNYSLTQFHVIDANGNVLFSTPLKDSNKAYLVSNPLPIDFEVQKDKVTKLSPEVLSVENTLASDFGYTTFSFNVVKTFDFLVSVFVYNPIIQNYELTTAKIKATGNEPNIYIDSLKAITNQITLREGSEEYSIEISKTLYKTYKENFSIDSLKSLFINPLKVILEKNDMIEGLIAYYPFNGNANDESGNGNNGTNYGATLSNDQIGNENSAYSFNGSSSYIELNQAFDLKEGTYSMWINAKTFPLWDYPATPSMSTFFGTDNPNLEYGGFSLNIANKNSVNEVFIRVGSMYGNCEFDLPIIKSTWNHVVLAKDLNNITVYLNGLLVSTKEIDIAVSAQGSPNAIIGASRNKNNRFFDGSIDEIRIYNRVLSDTEIGILYSIK